MIDRCTPEDVADTSQRFQVVLAEDLARIVGGVAPKLNPARLKQLEQMAEAMGCKLVGGCMVPKANVAAYEAHAASAGVSLDTYLSKWKAGLLDSIRGHLSTK